MGTDEATIAEIMGHRALLQRMDIKKKYKLSYGKDLIDDIDAEMKPSADFKSTCRALLMQPDEFDAYSLYHAMKGLGTDEDCLIEIIFTRTNEQLKKIRETYKSSARRSRCLCTFTHHNSCLQVHVRSCVQCSIRTSRRT